MKKLILLIAIVCLLPFTVSAQEDGNEWQELASMEVPRSEYAGVAYDGKLYVLGGFGEDYADFDAAQVFEVYDIETDTWELLEPLPDAGRHHLMMTEFGGELYVFGGSPMGTLNARDLPTLVYNIETNEWREVARMPSPRTAGVAVVIDEDIYIVGGTGTRMRNNELLKYTPSTDEWQVLGQQPIVRDHVAAVAYNGEIWAIGGRNLGVEDFTSISVYNPETETWSEGPRLNNARAGFGATVIDDYIFVAGGEVLDMCNSFPCTEEGAVEQSVEMYDPETETWSVVTETPIALHGLPLLAHERNLYVIGGSTLAAGIDNPGNTYMWAFESE